MKKNKIKIPNWVIIIAALVLVIGLTSTLVRASGRFNLPLSWILTPSGTSVDTDNDGLIDFDRLPSGIITMFDTDCPSGWTRVTALDGKFLVASSTYNTAAGGSNTQTHGAGTLSGDSAGAHTHGFTPAGTVSTPTFSGNAGTTGNESAHTHSYCRGFFTQYGRRGSGVAPNCSTQSLSTSVAWTDETKSETWGGTTNTTGSGSAHSHSFTPAGTVSTPTFSGNAGTVDSDGAHTHTISGSTGSADNRPEYATIIICKKD